MTDNIEYPTISTSMWIMNSRGTKAMKQETEAADIPYYVSMINLTNGNVMWYSIFQQPHMKNLKMLH